MIKQIREYAALPGGFGIIVGVSMFLSISILGFARPLLIPYAPDELIGDGFEAVALGGAEGGEFFFELVLFGVVGGGELRLKLRNFFRKFLGEVFGVAEVLEGEFGDSVQAGGGDADLFGGRGDRAGEGFESPLAIIEHFVFHALIVSDDRHEAGDRADDQAEDDGQGRAIRERAGTAPGDEAGGAE